MKKKEIEVKFFLNNIKAMEERLLSQGAELISPRVHEINLRFDRPDGELKRQHQVLRLRKDHEAWLTFKGAALQGQEASVRQEIEFKVSDYEAARDFLEALGYGVVVMYEKFRTSYKLDDCLVVLDEMPYGDFTEIEAGDVGKIKPLVDRLGLNWEARCVESYLELFEKVCKKRGLYPMHLSFDEFKGRTFNAEDFGIQPGDR